MKITLIFACFTISTSLTLDFEEMLHQQDDVDPHFYWHYCLGCKATVDHFFTIASKRIRKKIDNISVGERIVPEIMASDVAKRLCQSSLFNGYENYARYGFF